MKQRPYLFEKYPALRNKVPWIELLKNIPSPIERLEDLEAHLGLKEGAIYIKRDDKNHDIYGGNKLRKFEFLFGSVKKKKRKAIAAIGSVGTNHGLASGIIARSFNPPLEHHLFLVPQPLSWHVQRSLLLFDYFGPTIFHYANHDIGLMRKILFFKLRHPRSLVMLPGGSLFMGIGTSVGTIGFIEAIFELKQQIDDGIIPEPDVIFVPCGSTGTAAGLIVGCNLLKLKTKVKAIAVSAKRIANENAIIKNFEKVLSYLAKKDEQFQNISISKDSFEIDYNYLGSDYGVVTESSKNAVDLMMELEGKNRGFLLETTYTGKTLAAMLDFVKKEENHNKKVLFWNTYNSNDLDEYLRKTNFDWKKLPAELHQFFSREYFQCWQITNCPAEKRTKCPAYLNHEYRCWKIIQCPINDRESCEAYLGLKDKIEIEKL